MKKADTFKNKVKSFTRSITFDRRTYSKAYFSEPIVLDAGKEYLLVADYDKQTLTIYRKVGQLKEGEI